jgi:hypothetical protein
MEIRRTRLLIIVAGFLLIISAVTFLEILIYFIRFFIKYNLIIIPLENQTGLILPLIPTTRILLSILGIIGGWLLFKKRRSGFVLASLWSIFQIPSITLVYGHTIKSIMMGSGILNLQYIFFGSQWLRTTQEYMSVSPFSAINYSIGFGINFIGVAFLILLILLWMQIKLYLKQKIWKITRKSFVWISTGAQFAFILMVAGVLLNYHLSKPSPPKLTISIDKIELPCALDYISESDTSRLILANVYSNIKNTGNDTTIQRIYLSLQIARNYKWQDVPIFSDFYPAGLNEGALSFYSQEGRQQFYFQDRLWSQFPPQVKKQEFKPVRIAHDHVEQVVCSFLIPMSNIIEPFALGSATPFAFKGQVIAETVAGREFESEHFCLFVPAPKFLYKIKIRPS